MTSLPLSIRAELPFDHDAIERLHQRAFGPGRFARTAYRLREMAGEDAVFGFTAHVGTFLAGSVRLTPVLAGAVNAAMLGPLTVDPAFEGKGIGAALMSEGIGDARKRGIALILLVGDLAYYSRFGFKPVPPGHIILPGPVDPARFLALELSEGALKLGGGQVSPPVS
ncbi:MAG: GNAT family N-acetyltransferase [Bosea sp. (in: a-proteobacteria)]